ncbi:MAG TPA: copper resistance protein CopZ [Leptospiraceae bacterium]|nr:copper resistance protein CopZ [Leptospiraceae bacterium]|tara:strand:+ start:3200 stop:3400 length:201 start_codon:yes stop_codon:yes gene_type:complete
MKTIEFEIEGMSCSHCVHTAEQTLAELGVEAKADLKTGKARAVLSDDSVGIAEIREALNREGYEVK